MFDPDKFMDQSADAGSTTIKPIPAGEYTAMIEEVAKPRVITGPRGDSVVMDITFKLMDVSPAVAKDLGRQNFTIRRGYFLDVTPNNALDMAEGKNVALNQLRAALGQNTSGWTPGKLRGAGPLKVTVTLRPDKNNPDVVFNDIGKVGKAA